MKGINKNKVEKELQKALALEFVKEYCKQNNYSIDILSNLEFAISYNECGFLHPSGISPDGLINDMETLPQVVLLIRYDDGKLTIEDTEYTKKYLCI